MKIKKNGPWKCLKISVKISYLTFGGTTQAWRRTAVRRTRALWRRRKAWRWVSASRRRGTSSVQPRLVTASTTCSRLLHVPRCTRHEPNDDVASVKFSELPTSTVSSPKPTIIIYTLKALSHWPRPPRTSCLTTRISIDHDECGIVISVIVSLPVEVWSIVMSPFVCPLTHLLILHRSMTALWRYRTVLPVLWMTSCFHIIGAMARRVLFSKSEDSTVWMPSCHSTNSRSSK